MFPEGSREADKTCLLTSEQPHWLRGLGFVLNQLGRMKRFTDRPINGFLPGQRVGGSSDNTERTVSAATDKMRGAMDSGEFKHGELGLLFLRYVSAAFEVKRQELTDEVAD